MKPISMRAVAALTASRDEKPALAAQGQERVEQERLGVAGHEARAELAHHRSVEARVDEVEAQELLPVDAASSRVGRAEVHEVLGERKQGNERQPPGCLGRVATEEEQCRELRVGEHGAEFIPQPQVGIASRERGSGHGGGLAGNLGGRAWMQRHDDPPRASDCAVTSTS